MDKDTVGDEIYGYKVLSYDEVVERVQLIIIVANMSVVEMIGRRIAFLNREHGIDILYINGKRLETRNDVSTYSYWDTNLEELKIAIDQNDVISFDLFDTLLMRKVLLPSNIFDLVERELAERFSVFINYKAARIEADKYCFRNIEQCFTMEQVYDRLQETLHLTDELKEQIKLIEYDIEHKCCVPRHVLVECFNYGLKQKKNICITTDTYWARNMIEKLLSKYKIKGYERLFISCELKKSKSEGSMWEHIANLYKGKNILHIGDNSHTDIDMPRHYAINAFEIKNAYELMSMSALNSLIVEGNKIDDFVMLGQFAARFLNDPFALSKTKGKITINNAFDLGYISFGPLVLGYVLWLIAMVENRIDTLLFFARDGFILEKIYRKVVTQYNINAPQGIYYLISRRAASVAALRNSKDIEFVVRKLCKIKKIKIKQILFHAFGVQADQSDLIANKYYYELSEEELLEYVLQRYKNVILSNAQKERNGYLAYNHDLGLNTANKIGVVNFVGRGVTQRCLSQIINKELFGYYFATEYDTVDILESAKYFNSFYKEMVSPHMGEFNLSTKYLFGEVVFSSSDEQFIKFDEKKEPIFDTRKNERDISLIQECHRGIEQYVDDAMAMDEKLLQRAFSVKLIDNFYGLFLSQNCICSERIKKAFVFFDYYNPESQKLLCSD